MIYLDNAATTSPKPERVYRAVLESLRLGGNAGRGEHALAKAANYVLYEAREKLAELFNIKNPNQIVFANNATDALNTALLGLLNAGERVVTTSMEHNSVSRPLRWMESQGVVVDVLPCNRNGEVDLAELEVALQHNVKVLVMSHASNVTGTLIPVEQIGKLALEYGVTFLLDAAQTAGNQMIDVQRQHIDMLAFSGHKSLFGPPGTGGLYVKTGIKIRPSRFGGTGSQSEKDSLPNFLPDMLEVGTMNTPGIAGLLAGVNFILDTGIGNIMAREEQLAIRLMKGLKEIEQVTLYAEHAAKRNSVISFTIQGQDSTRIAYELGQKYNIICRAGLHCAPWAHKTIGTLHTGTVRLSLGYFTTEAQIEETIAAIQRISERGTTIL